MLDVDCPSGTVLLRPCQAEASAGDPRLADTLLNSLNLALTEALRDVFTVLWIAVALSSAVALFLRVPADTDRRYNRYNLRG